MFVLTTLVYPVVLALLCVGAGLLVDRASGEVLPAMLLPAVGVAALIVASQLSTYVAPVAPATPYLLATVALAGWALGWGRAQALARAWRRSAPWGLCVGPIAYALALAPVLLAGRPTFSSYMALADSAVHMLGADYLIRHGQDYSHLDLRNSYGAFMNAYYAASYPSGADTLLGGSARLLRLPLIWAFQPLVAFVLATASGPAWVLVRRVGLDRGWAAVGALTVTLPALVYAYELIGSVKEIVALALILTMGALVVEHRRWLWGGARGAIPFALVVAAGVAALGVAFGAWALAATLVLATVAIAELRRAGLGRGARTAAEHVAQTAAPRARVGQPLSLHGQTREELASAAGGASPPARVGRPTSRDPRTGRELASADPGARSPKRLAALAVAGALVLLVGAWATWVHLSGSLRVARAIASTSNPGNLHSPLRPAQLLGVWLRGSYKLLPTGVALALTYVLVAVVLALAVLGLGKAVRTGRYALAGWFALTILLWLALGTYATTWAEAKTLMLTSPAVVLMAWAGIAALRASPLRIAAPLAAFVLVGGVLASDALQYHESNLAPTARYEELASVNARFAGRGPTLLADFDEYALYVLRDMDVGGPDFVYPPPALAGAAGGYGRPIALDRVAPAALLAYPLIVTRRDPSAPRPPAAYRLEWQGVYYQVWGRIPGASSRAGVRFGARHPQLVSVPLARAVRPPGWGLSRGRIVMGRAGTLSATFALPRSGAWELWLKGDVMRALTVRVDGRAIGRLGGQLDGNSLVVNVLTPLRTRLGAGRHTLTIARPGADLAPGDGGAAVLAAIFLVPAVSL